MGMHKSFVLYSPNYGIGSALNDLMCKTFSEEEESESFSEQKIKTLMPVFKQIQDVYGKHLGRVEAEQASSEANQIKSLTHLLQKDYFEEEEKKEGNDDDDDDTREQDALACQCHFCMEFQQFRNWNASDRTATSIFEGVIIKALHKLE